MVWGRPVIFVWKPVVMRSYLRDLALGGSPALGEDGSGAVFVLQAVEHE